MGEARRRKGAMSHPVHFRAAVFMSEENIEALKRNQAGLHLYVYAGPSNVEVQDDERQVFITGRVPE